MLGRFIAIIITLIIIIVPSAIFACASTFISCTLIRTVTVVTVATITRRTCTVIIITATISRIFTATNVCTYTSTTRVIDCI